MATILFQHNESKAYMEFPEDIDHADYLDVSQRVRDIRPGNDMHRLFLVAGVVLCLLQPYTANSKKVVLANFKL